MRLVGVELSRFFSRRAVVLLLVATGLLTAFIAGTTVWETRPLSAQEVASARAQAAKEASSPQFQQDLSNCRAAPEQYVGPDATAADCDQMVPVAENFLGRATLSIDEQQEQGGLAVVSLLAAALVIVGTSYAGADWATGSMSNQLLFEPRRLRVWFAKAVTVTIASAAVSALLLAVFWSALLVAARSRGISTPDPVLESVGWLVARGVVLAAFAGLAGYALTMLMRSTVATLALLFAYAVVGEALLALAPLPRPGRWSLANNVFAWVSDGVQVYDEGIECGMNDMGCDQTFTLGLAHGATYLTVLLALALVASAATFRRRDIP